jgi:hypothetical protein
MVRQAIKNECDGKVLCDVIVDIFIDFSQTRNKMLEYAERNYCAEGDFIMLLDANDQLKYDNNVKDKLTAVPGDVNYIMCYSNWLYAGNNNMTHIKILFVRPFKNIRYEFPVHEYITMNGEMIPNYYFINNVELFQNRNINGESERTKERHERDIRLLEKELSNKKNVNRALFYIGKTYMTDNEFDKAEFYLKKRAEIVSGDLEEVYNSYLFLGTIELKKCIYDKSDKLAYYKNKVHHNKVKKYFTRALSIMTRIDVLIYLADYYMSCQKWNLAHIYTDIGSRLPQPANGHSYNKKFYLFTIHMYNAAICYNLKKYSEGISSLKIALNYFKTGGYLSEDDINKLRVIVSGYENAAFQPHVQNVKYVNKPVDSYTKNNSDKPIIAFVCGKYWTKWDGDTANSEDGIGGSELVAIKMAEHIDKSKWTVVFFCDCLSEKTINNVKYYPLLEYICFLEQNIVDTLVVYRFAPLIKYNNVNNVILSMEDVSFLGGTIMILPDKFRYLLCKSQWQYDLHCVKQPQLAKFLRIVGNGIDPSRFPNNVDKVKNRFIYSSDPTRGLDNLLRIFSKWKAYNEDATLAVFFDIEIVDYGDRKQSVLELYERAKNTPGVIMNKRVSQSELANEIMKSEYWLYPTNFTETYCISAHEMMAGRVHCVYHNIGALSETINDKGIPVNADPSQPENDQMYLEALTRASAQSLDYAEKYAKSMTWERAGNNLELLICSYHF